MAKSKTNSKNTSQKIFLGVSILAVLMLIGGVVVALIGKNSVFSMHTQPKYIAPYLYEISYTDYEEDVEGVTHVDMEVFGCSSVKNGNFYGRNFDYIFNDTPEFIVHMSAKEGRHASIGVATHYGLREIGMERQIYDKQLDLIPNLTLDGINDAGVIASINVVPGEPDVAPLTGTDPTKEPLNAAFAVRYILDNASSADDAVELLKNRNLSGTAVDNMHLHIMIADESKTYIAEFIDNSLVVKEKHGDEQIMTNFYVNLPELTEHAAGVERYNILKENYNKGSTFIGMRDLMKMVKYSNAYAYSTDPWYSEALTQSQIAYVGSPEFDIYYEIYKNLQEDYWNYKSNDIRNPASKAFWHTTHSSVYDIEKRALRISVQENFATYFDFAL